MFNFDENYKHCFDNVKNAVKVTQTLGLYDPVGDLVLEIDVSTKGIRLCLMQNSRPISYTSKSLTKTESNYSNIECECLAMVFGLEHFKPFYYGHPVIVKSDQKPLKSIFSNPSHLHLLISRECSYKLASMMLK